MAINRRDFLKITGMSLGGLALTEPATSTLLKVNKTASTDGSASMLYDATICIGCKACQVACKRRSNLPPVLDSDKTHEAPTDLSADVWTLIKLYKGDEGTSFVKAQCMHCIEPACVSVCPVAALEKTDTGPVVYHAERCIGCRYCMAACPFYIPKAQWYSNSPKIQKCDFCADRLAKGQNPACGDACPTGALIYGKRGEMLATARSRTQDQNRYINHIYGETEAGGTDMLYIAGVSMGKLGFPDLGSRSLPSYDWPYMLAVPWVVAVVGGLLTATYFYTHRHEDGKEVHDDRTNG
jgi:formate dehydrogenase iron-sulfur subunit